MVIQQRRIVTLSDNLDSINTATAATTVIGATGLGGIAGTLAEIAGTLHATDANHNLYTVNATIGTAHLIGSAGIPPLISTLPP